MADFTRAMTTLEYHKVLELLSGCARTEAGRERLLTLTPTDRELRIRRWLGQTDAAKALVQQKGAPPFCGVHDVQNTLERAHKGAILRFSELLDIALLLRCSRMMHDYIADDKTGVTVLDELFFAIVPNRRLEDRITRSVISEDAIADDASPTLAEIRRKMRAALTRIKDVLSRYTGGDYGKYLQENIVTTRGGRYVVPVKNEYRSEIKGLLHDTSASGATVFIEPMAVVEANNELRELESAEAHEIEKILAELSALCRDNAAVMQKNFSQITELDCIFARAELSYRMNAVSPVLEDHPMIDLHRARHPLLDPKTVVPVDVSLGVDFDTVVITGPNTGGKTVTLKTLGLLAMMLQSGLHIPAREDSRMGIFPGIWADIGDEQSIEQSLSTFSSHMVNIVRILSGAEPGALVLIDELGSGTDPVEGAALAVSILEEFRELHCLCAATTHYAELKEYALNTDGVCNAGCEFDVETLKPTYRLILGTPGRSNAFTISQKLGVPAPVIERAKTYVAGDRRRFEDMLEKLERTREELEREKETEHAARVAYEAFAKQAENELRQKLAGAEKEAERMKNEARRLLQSARASSDTVFSQLSEIKKIRNQAQLAERLDEAKRAVRTSLSEADEAVNPVVSRSNKDYVLPRPLKKGDTVLIVSLNREGVLESDPDKNGNVTVQAGVLHTRTKVKNLRLVEMQKPAAAPKKTVKEIVMREFSPSIDLRGMIGDDAWFMVDKYLDDAKLAQVQSVTLIHGKGTGALRKALWTDLKRDPRVKSMRLGTYGEGDAGVTVVELK